MIRIKKLMWAPFLACVVILAATVGFAQDVQDEYADEPTARVARIKFLEGDAELKRIDSEEWEKAALNLPMVEGDELKTLEGSKVEIQFDNNTYLRVDESSALRLVSLGDEGAAVSLSSGSAVFSVLSMEADAGYLEIDAPQTTIAITKEGRYRIDAGDEFNRTVRVSVRDGGTARLYTLDSGFTLKSDQTALMSLDGVYAGKWEVSRNLGDLDDFDQWSADRDQFINKSLADAHYGQYYDSNIYGADDLNYYGSWQYNNSYGYVWSPYDNVVSNYDNWSPYRYGSWRWLPYFGWTWVNDEPWGWSTYHYGRWISINGRWFWTPYSYYNYYGGRRSWWRPALVYMGYYGTIICWYPLPYNYRYYDYNHRYRDRWPNRRRDRNNTSSPQTPNASNVARGDRLRTPPLQRIPPTAVISANRDVFGKKMGRYETAPPIISKEILSKKDTQGETPPILPPRKEWNSKKSPDIIVLDRGTTDKKGTVKIGAAERKTGEPLDTKLKREKMYRNRPPLTTIPRVEPGADGQTETRRTGVFPRAENPKKIKPTYSPPVNSPSPTTKQEDRRPSPPVSRPAPTTIPEERKTSPPIYRPQPKQEERKPSPPVYVPPTRRPDPPRQEPRRTDPAPTRPQPTRRPDPPAKSPPAKSSPKSESKPAPKPPPLDKKTGT
jgi:hypothetical protein